MRGGVDEDTEPQDLSNKQVVALHQLLHEAKFKDPDKDHLSPAGITCPDTVSPPLHHLIDAAGSIVTWRSLQAESLIAPLRSCLRLALSIVEHAPKHPRTCRYTLA